MIKYTTDTLENVSIDCFGIINSCYGNETLKYFEKTKNNFVKKRSKLIIERSLSSFFEYRAKSLSGRSKVNLLLNTNYAPYYGPSFPTIYFMITHMTEDDPIRYNSLKGNLIQIKKEAKQSKIGFPYGMGVPEKLEWDKVHSILNEVFEDMDIIVFEAPKEVVKQYSKIGLWSKIKRLFS